MVSVRLSEYFTGVTCHYLVELPTSVQSSERPLHVTLDVTNRPQLVAVVDQFSVFVKRGCANEPAESRKSIHSSYLNAERVLHTVSTFVDSSVMYLPSYPDRS